MLVSAAKPGRVSSFPEEPLIWTTRRMSFRVPWTSGIVAGALLTRDPAMSCPRGFRDVSRSRMGSSHITGQFDSGRLCSKELSIRLCSPARPRSELRFRDGRYLWPMLTLIDGSLRYRGIGVAAIPCPAVSRCCAVVLAVDLRSGERSSAACVWVCRGRQCTSRIFAAGP